MERKPQSGPLQGLRILDLTRLYPGPLGTMMLADMGADVIKIEDMNAPDYMRFYPPYIESESAGFIAVNRSKRSLALNLKTKKGVGIFYRLSKRRTWSSNNSGRACLPNWAWAMKMPAP